MKQTLILLIITAVLLTALPVWASAAGAPGIALTCLEQGEGAYTVTVSFTDIPGNNGVEYAQIRLVGAFAAYQIGGDSVRLQETGEVLLTSRYDALADSLLVLLEPKGSGFSGIGNGAVFTFALSRIGDSSRDPGFTLTAVLILKDGTELELDQYISAALPAAPTTVPPTVPATTTPTTVPPTVPATAAPTTVPPTVPATAAPTTVPPTVAPTTVAPTVPATAAPTTMPPATTIPGVTTTVPVTEPTTTATAAPTTMPTAAPTTAPATQPGGEEPALRQTPWGLIVGILAVALAAAAWLAWAWKKKLPPFSALKEGKDASV